MGELGDLEFETYNSDDAAKLWAGWPGLPVWSKVVGKSKALQALLFGPKAPSPMHRARALVWKGDPTQLADLWTIPEAQSTFEALHELAPAFLACPDQGYKLFCHSGKAQMPSR